MGNTVCKTMKIDKIILQAHRGKYAKVFVEVNLSQPLVPFISILGRLQRVEYEGLFVICFDCENYSHKSENFPATGIQQPKPNPPESKIPDEQEGLEKLFGPWMFLAWRRMQNHGQRGWSTSPNDFNAAVVENPLCVFRLVY